MFGGRQRGTEEGGAGKGPAVGVGSSPIPQYDGGRDRSQDLEEMKEEPFRCWPGHNLHRGTMSGVGSCSSCKEDISFKYAKFCGKHKCDYKLCFDCDWKLRNNLKC